MYVRIYAHMYVFMHMWMYVPVVEGAWSGGHLVKGTHSNTLLHTATHGVSAYLLFIRCLLERTPCNLDTHTHCNTLQHAATHNTCCG